MKQKLWLLAMLPGLAFAANEDVNVPQSTMKFNVDAAFTYWYAKEDGLNVAESAVLGERGVTYLAPVTEVFTQSFGYKPGFKVGLGMESSDKWALQGVYTYYRGTTTASGAAPENTSVVPGLGVWNMEDWFLQDKLLGGASLVGTNLSSTWHLGMDLGDVYASRPFEMGSTVVFSPFGGLRTVWLRQKMDVALTQAAASFETPILIPDQPLYSYNSSHAWGIGPRVGTSGRCMLPMGFRFEGMFGASLLYTKFTSVNHEEQRQSLGIPNPTYQFNLTNYNCVRPVFDLGLGLGWGMCQSEKYRFDIAANYDFSYFFGQNMMRTILDEAWGGVASGDNDLYFQGLTISASFSF